MEQIIYLVKEFADNKSDTEKLQLLRNITVILCENNLKYNQFNDEISESKQEDEQMVTEYPLSDSDYPMPIETPKGMLVKRKRKLSNFNNERESKKRKIFFNHQHNEEMESIDNMNPDKIQELINNFEQQVKTKSGFQDDDFHVINQSDTRWNIHDGELIRNDTLTELHLNEKEIKMIEDFEIMEEVLKIENTYRSQSKY